MLDQSHGPLHFQIKAEGVNDRPEVKERKQLASAAL